MLPQSPSQIYKASLRGREEDGRYRCLSTFNFGTYFDETRKAFGSLKVLNDETLGPQQIKTFSLEKGESVILIPLVGTIDYMDGFENQNYIETEEIQVLQTIEPTTFTIQNPYEIELVNYLQIRLVSIKSSRFFYRKKRFDFKKRDELISLIQNDDYKISIGIFGGRNEGTYPLLKKGKGVFAFIVSGAFEFQNRLLETRDGLAIWEVNEIEFESLSENAILLVIETTLQE